VELSLKPRHEKKLNKKEFANHYASGQVPAAVFGKSIEPGLCFVNIKHAHSWHRGSMFDVSWHGEDFKASISEIQYHPVHKRVQHISFHLVGKNEVTHIEVPFKFVGSSLGEKAGGMISHQRESISLKGKPDHFPEFIEIDVTNLDINGKITLADIPCPAHTEYYHAELDWPIVTCAHVKVQEVETSETAAEETELQEAHASEEASEKQAA